MMPLGRRLWKPWFLYHPRQLLRRASAMVHASSPGYRGLQTSWGVRVCADPTKAIGRSILTTGVYDLAVSEVLARLIDPGDTAIDVGAHIGYMTVLASVAAGPTGKVISFEAHPGLFAVTRQNIHAARRQCQIAPVELHNVALGEREGMATLVMPSDFESNDGVARISSAAPPLSRAISVRVRALDDILADGSVSVLKLDVEGFELQALRGTSQALESRRVRHIVFEDHHVETSAVVTFLRAVGYHVYALGWSMRGPSLRPVEQGRLATAYEAPSYLASAEPHDALARCRSRGWLTLGRGLIERCGPSRTR